jgi:hypothetical protein
VPDLHDKSLDELLGRAAIERFAPPESARDEIARRFDALAKERDEAREKRDTYIQGYSDEAHARARAEAEVARLRDEVAERLAVNVGLIAENDALKRKLAARAATGGAA